MKEPFIILIRMVKLKTRLTVLGVLAASTTQRIRLPNGKVAYTTRTNGKMEPLYIKAIKTAYWDTEIFYRIRRMLYHLGTHYRKDDTVIRVQVGNEEGFSPSMKAILIPSQQHFMKHGNNEQTKLTIHNLWKFLPVSMASIGAFGNRTRSF
ncbi:hypothetical protein [Bacteroides sp.]|uniref:hypothetical protein n=1 Tax=Bacteroides sp. TaxID=29523 RepID=UPI002FCC9B9F